MAIVKDKYLRFQTWVCQNVSNKVLLAWSKFQAKLPSRSGVCVQREWQKCSSPSPPLPKDEGISDIGHCSSIGNLVLGVNSVTVLYLIHYDSLLQNATDIITHYYTMRKLFYYKTREKFITKCVRFFITKCDVYYKLQEDIGLFCTLLFMSKKHLKNCY